MTAISVRVVLNEPRIDFDTVTFTWTEPFRSPAESMLFYRYEGIDLAQFSRELWLEIWLSLQLREYLPVDGPVEIVLPAAIPRPSLEFWLAYYGLENISVTPVSDAAKYEPFRTRCQSQSDVAPAAGVFFGGGRDSLATACLLGEIYGPDRVLLMTCIDPLRPSDRPQQRVAARYERHMLQPAREAGFAVQRVFTNLHAIRRQFGKGPLEPHLEQYTAALLPVLLARDIPISTFCYAWFEYVILHSDEGVRFRYERSRPEVLAAQSLHYQRVLGFEHELTDVNLTMTGQLAVRLLSDRYPAALPNIFMCQKGSVAERWCYDCGKCSNYVRYCLALGVHDAEFDFDRFLTRSHWITNVISKVNAFSRSPLPGENVSWSPEIAPQLSFANFCNACAMVDPAFARDHFNDDAFFNVMLLKAFFGNHYQPGWETTPVQSFSAQPAALGSRLRRIIETYHPIVETQPVLLETGGLICEGPFNRPFRPAVAKLAHLQ